MVLVAGASGFLVSYLIKELLRQGEKKMISTNRSGTAYVENERIEPIAFDAIQPFQIVAPARRVGSLEPITFYYLAVTHQPETRSKKTP